MWIVQINAGRGPSFYGSVMNETGSLVIIQGHQLLMSQCVTVHVSKLIVGSTVGLQTQKAAARVYAGK